jgi:hypothetical protein
MVLDVTIELTADVLVAEAGPSQCQWSPCGSQPTDSVGLGAIVPLPASSVCSSWSWSSATLVVVVICAGGAVVVVGLGTVVTAAGSLVRGLSQCLVWS